MGYNHRIDNVEHAAATPLATTNEHLSKIYQELCWWAQPTYGDTGESWEKTMWKAALIGVAILNTTTATSIAWKRYDIARRYANLSEDRFNRFKDYYAPLERKYLSEVGNMKQYDPDYPAARARAEENTNSAYVWADDTLSDHAKRFALCLDDSLLDDMAIQESIDLSDGANFNYRKEEYWKYYYQDKTWNYRSELLNLGRGLMALAFQYGQAANEAFKGVGALVDKGAKGAMSAIGYLGSVFETQYPAMFSGASPVTGQASGTVGSALVYGPMSTY